DDAAFGAVVLKLDRAGNLGEQRVVLAAADVEAGIEATAALGDEDGAAGHDVAVESLDAEALRIAVTPVSRTSLTLFCCHLLRPYLLKELELTLEPTPDPCCPCCLWL